MILICAGSTAVVAGTLFAKARFGLPLGEDKRIAAINTVATLASFVVVTLAGVVAITAYRPASGRPQLIAEVRFAGSRANAPVFTIPINAYDSENLELMELDLIDGPSLDGVIVLHSASRYSARNPGGRISFHGLANVKEQEAWGTVSRGTLAGVTAIQWDGGADLLIHGKWARTLPAFSLNGASVWAQGQHGAHLKVTVVADGIDPKTTGLPISWRQ